MITLNKKLIKYNTEVMLNKINYCIIVVLNYLK